MVKPEGVMGASRSVGLLTAVFALVVGVGAGGAGAEEADLLRPRALANEAGPAAPDELKAQFADPPAEYRSMPLWVWNDEMEWPRLEEQLRQYKAQGMGGAFVHPRPGLMTEYLGADWFRLWRDSASAGSKLGLLVNIYDENSYPSGFAGGHVPSLAPETASQYVQARRVDKGAIQSHRSTTVAYFAVRTGADGTVQEARRVGSEEDVEPGWEVYAFQLRRASGNPWTAEFPYVDLTNPRTAQVFLETTYERYKRELGDQFGKTIRWSFTDEPLIATGGAYDSAELALPLSFNTLSEFQKRNGYDLADRIASLYWDVGGYQKVRFDYWQTIHDLWKENFLRPIFSWCDRNGLQFTGHWMEHEWPYPWITPADANLYAFEHVPGIDMLEGTKLRLNGKDPHMLFTIKQVASVSHQLGRRAFCEAYGVAGWDSTFEHYKRFGDWLMVHGINFINQHLSFSTIRGARKRDHPQSFSDVSPWWPYYRYHADHLARVSLASSRSESRNRVLVLQQTTSGFLLARRAGPTPELEEMRSRNAELNQVLADRQIDFDLGDEYMIEWFGKAEGGRFQIGKASYQLLVWPPDMTNLRRQTIPHLRSFLEGGGRILALSDPARFVDGRPSREFVELVARFPGQWERLEENGALVARIRVLAKPRIEFDREVPSGIGFLERYLEGGDRVLFLTNSGLEPFRAKASVEGGSVELLDTVTGTPQPIPFRATGDRVGFDVQLPPAGSMLIVASAASADAVEMPRVQWMSASTEAWKTSPESKNVLVLDYCDLAVGGENLEDINTWEANWTLWQKHGFERPAWDNAVQFRTGVFDRNHFPPESGFEVRFHFEVGEGAPLEGLELAVELPELYAVEVNGKAVDFTSAASWMDPHLRSASMDGMVHRGENLVVLKGRPFDVRMELENVYIRGDFGVEPTGRGFRLVGARSLDFGSWGRQGYRFFGDSVTYQTDVQVPAGFDRLRVSLKDWQGSLVSVLVDGSQVGIMGWPPYELAVPVTAGRHEVGLRVVSTPRNVLGPFHNPAKLRMRAWPAAWAEFPARQPKGEDYDLLDYGLFEPPEIAIGKP